MEKVKLNVVGITYSQVQTGAYALVLSEEGGPYRIPVVIGVAEAQAIAVKIENIIPPRPLSHDLIVGLSHAYGINLDDVFLYKFENGVFLSELHFSSDDRSVTIDSRTSDAIALALRTGAPIYTTREILEQTGFKTDKNDTSTQDNPDSAPKEVNLKKFAITELKKMMSKCVEQENYEQAAEIKRIIAEKTEEQKTK